MTALVWKQPPPPTRTDWNAVGEQLRQHPGEWARVAIRDTKPQAMKLTSELRFGRSLGACVPRSVILEIGAYEIERHGCEVYARFVGAA